MNRAQIVQQFLPFKANRPGSQWRLRDASVEPLVDRVLKIIADGGSSDPEVTWYKRAERKQVFRFSGNHVAKVISLPALMLRLKHRRYARDEAAYMIVASEKGIRVPPLHAIGSIRTRLGLVGQTVMIFGELTGMRTAIEMIKDAEGDRERIDAVLDAALPLFVLLYQSGCKHIDVNSGNVMLNPADLSEPPALIDFRYAGFHVRPSVEVTMFQAAQFISFCGEHVAPASVERWLEALIDRLGVEGAARREWCRTRFAFYRRNKLLRKQRQRINPHPDMTPFADDHARPGGALRPSF